MSTPTEAERVLELAVAGTDEAAMWICVDVLIGKGTARALVLAFVLVQRWIEANRHLAEPEQIARVLDRFEESVSA